MIDVLVQTMRTGGGTGLSSRRLVAAMSDAEGDVQRVAVARRGGVRVPSRHVARAQRRRRDGLTHVEAPSAHRLDRRKDLRGRIEPPVLLARELDHEDVLVVGVRVEREAPSRAMRAAG